MTNTVTAYFFTQGGKVARFVRLAGTKPDLYEVEIEGAKRTFIPSALIHIPNHVLPTIKQTK